MVSDDADGRDADGRATRVALVELSPALAERLRDPRLVLALVAAVVGAVALLVGYLGVSGTLDPAKQLPYLVSGGVGGLFLLGVASALLFSADLGVTRREIADLRSAVDRLASRVEDLHDLHHLHAGQEHGGGENGAVADPTPPRRRAARASKAVKAAGTRRRS